ncbi:Ig-like domain-containing protein, partial [uncultured Zobellia sp.]|uniref:Ig-like domain-containing protein n=1 Tax=uncultured Zobellia sp. TaxID=255433 RepID=UPI002594DCAA
QVTGVSPGTAIITVTTQDGNFTATATITVEAATVDVAGVSVAPATATVTAGEDADLTSNVSPANASNPSVSWSSSNPAVATVNGEGQVTGVSPGTAVITVTTQDGNFTATATITVEAITQNITFSNGNSIGNGMTSIMGTLTISNTPVTLRLTAFGGAGATTDTTSVIFSINGIGTYTLSAEAYKWEELVIPDIIPVGSYNYTLSGTFVGTSGNGASVAESP